MATLTEAGWNALEDGLDTAAPSLIWLPMLVAKPRFPFLCAPKIRGWTA